MTAHHTKSSRSRLSVALFCTALAVLFVTPRVADAGWDFEPSFNIDGYISLQGGVFVSPEKATSEFDQRAGREFPTNHGDRLGEPSMLLATMQLRADWHPARPVSLHAIFRGRRALTLPSDARDADPPFPDRVGDTATWVRDKYYNELDLREFYLSIEVNRLWSLRIGRQQRAWGEIGQYRLLDVINPTDETVHFGPLQSFEDSRIPLWMLISVMEIPALQGDLEVVWIPLLDKPENRVTTPLTFTGAWGLPLAPVQENRGVAAEKVHSKVFHYPGGGIEESRIGARWTGNVGMDLTYSLVYMYTHQLSPPVPTHHVSYWGRGEDGVEVHLDYPRQHIVGGSLGFTIEPLGLLMLIEAAYEPDRTFPAYSDATGADEVIQVPSTISNERGAIDAITPFHAHQKHVVNYAVRFMRPTMIRALNPTQNFNIVLQFMHSAVINFDSGQNLINVPGFDTSKLEQHSFTIVGLISTSYLNGRLNPTLVGVYLPPGDGFMSAQLGMTFGNHWRLRLAANMFWGAEPYNKVGFFRSRDEINLRVMYQF